MLSLHARKPAAAAHDTGGPVLVKLPASGGATARAGAEASLLGNRDAPGAAAGAAAPAGSSPEAQEAGSGAAAGAAASTAPSAAKAPKSHKDVPGASALPAVKQRVIDGCIDLAAQYTAHAAAAADLVRRDVFKVQAKYLSRFPPLVVSEYKRAKGGGHAADKSKKDLAFPRADLKARACAALRAPRPLTAARLSTGGGGPGGARQHRGRRARRESGRPVPQPRCVSRLFRGRSRELTQTGPPAQPWRVWSGC